MDYRNDGPIWELDLSHDEVVAINDAATLNPVPEPTFRTVVAAAAAHLKTVDEIGGRRGVTVTWVIGVAGVLVLPRGNSIYPQLQTVKDRLGDVAGHWCGVMEKAWRAAGQEMGEVWDHWREVAGGVWDNIIGGKRNRGEAVPGSVSAEANYPDAGATGLWERFQLVAHHGDLISLISWQGAFCAEDGGGRGVIANRPWIGPWEMWHLIQHGDGTVSLKASDNRHYLCANNGGGDRELCGVDRIEVGPWERFTLHTHGPHVLLRTALNKRWVAVRPD